MVLRELPQTPPITAAPVVRGSVVRNNHSIHTDSGLMFLNQSGTTFQIIQPGVEMGIDMCDIETGSIHKAGIRPIPAHTP